MHQASAASEPAAEPAPPTGRKARTRRALLEAAGELFSTRGVEGTTVDDIADAAEVSVGSIYKHFGSKEALAVTFIAEALAVFEGYLAEAQAAPRAVDRVLGAGDAYFRFAREQPAACRFATSRVFSPDASAPPDEASTVTSARVQAMLLAIAADVKAAMDDGDMPRAPIDEALVFLWGSWSGVAHLMLRRDAMAIPPELAERALTLGRTVFMSSFEGAAKPASPAAGD
jgi:AcrR family transcriptional regulator